MADFEHGIDVLGERFQVLVVRGYEVTETHAVHDGVRGLGIVDAGQEGHEGGQAGNAPPITRMARTPWPGLGRLPRQGRGG
jgi:hypothetical protein